MEVMRPLHHRKKKHICNNTKNELLLKNRFNITNSKSQATVRHGMESCYHICKGHPENQQKVYCPQVGWDILSMIASFFTWCFVRTRQNIWFSVQNKFLMTCCMKVPVITDGANREDMDMSSSFTLITGLRKQKTWPEMPWAHPINSPPSLLLQAWPDNHHSLIQCKDSLTRRILPACVNSEMGIGLSAEGNKRILLGLTMWGEPSHDALECQRVIITEEAHIVIKWETWYGGGSKSCLCILED